MGDNDKNDGDGNPKLSPIELSFTIQKDFQLPFRTHKHNDH